MATLNKVLKVAVDEIGYLEKKSNKDLDSKTANAGNGNFTKYWRDVYPSFQGEPWCDCFVKFCFLKAFGKIDVAKAQLCEKGKDWSFYTPTSANYFKQQNRFFAVPEPGDQVFFKDSSGTICHTGLVESVTNNQIITIEGNTSGASGVIDNGGGVCRKYYVRSYSRIAGYGRPLYDDGEWKKDLKGWWWQRYDGTWPKNEWLLIKDEWYYFENNGYAAKNKWLKLKDIWYWFTDSCAAAKSECVEVDKKWYAFDKNCHMITASINVNKNGDLRL